MTFANDNERDLGRFSASVLDLAGVSYFSQFFFEYCLILSLRDAVTIDQKIVGKRIGVVTFP